MERNASSAFDQQEHGAIGYLSTVSNEPDRDKEYYQQNPNILRDIETLIGNMEQTQAKQNENMLRNIENLLGNMLAKESRPQSRASNISGGYDRINVKSPIPAKNGLHVQQEQQSMESSIKNFVSQHIQDVVPDLVVHVQQDLTSNDIVRPFFDETKQNAEIVPFLEHAFHNYVEDLAAAEQQHTEILQISNFLRDNTTLQEELGHLQLDEQVEKGEEMNRAEARWELPITNEMVQLEDPNKVLLNIIEITNYATISAAEYLEETTVELINSNAVDECFVHITLVADNIQSLADSFDVPTILHVQPTEEPQKENVTKKKQKAKPKHQQPSNHKNPTNYSDQHVSATKIIAKTTEKNESNSPVLIQNASEIQIPSASNSTETEINTNALNGTISKDVSNTNLQKSTVITNIDHVIHPEVVQELQSTTPKLNINQNSFKVNTLERKSRIPVRKLSSVTAPTIKPIVQRSGETHESNIKVESINLELNDNIQNKSPEASVLTTDIARNSAVLHTSKAEISVMARTSEIENSNKEQDNRSYVNVVPNNETIRSDSETRIQETISELNIESVTVPTIEPEMQESHNEDPHANSLVTEPNSEEILVRMQIEYDSQANMQSSESDWANGPTVPVSESENIEPEATPDTDTGETEQHEHLETEQREHLSTSNSSSNVEHFINDEIMQSDLENGSIITASETDINTSDSERDSYTDDDSETEHNSISDAQVSANSAIAIGVNKSQQNLSELVSDTQRLIKLMKDEINSDIASFVSDEEEYSDDYASDSDQWTDDGEEEVEEEEELEQEEDGEEEYEDEEAEAEGENAVEDYENSWTETDGEYDSEYYEGIEVIDANQASDDRLSEQVNNDVNSNANASYALVANNDIENQEITITDPNINSEETDTEIIASENNVTVIEQFHNANGNVEDVAASIAIKPDSLDVQEQTKTNETEILTIHKSTELENFEIPQYAQTIEADLQNNIASIQKSLHVSTNISVERRSSRDINGEILQINVNEIVVETATTLPTLQTISGSMSTENAEKNTNSAIMSDITGSSVKAISVSTSASVNETKVKKPLQKIPVRKASLPGPFKSLQNSNVKAMQQELLKKTVTKPDKKVSKLSPPKIIPKSVTVSRTLSERITKFIKPFASGASSGAAAGSSGGASTSSAGASTSSNAKHSKVPTHKHEIPKKKYHETCFSDDYQSSDEEDVIVEKPISRLAPKRQQSMPNLMQTDIEFNVESQDVSFSFVILNGYLLKIQNVCSTWPADCSTREKLSTLWRPNLQPN